MSNASLPDPQPGATAFGCPSCPGALRSALLSPQYVEFRCRIGHVFAFDELVLAKEEQLEEALDACEVAAAELAALLRDARRDGSELSARNADRRSAALADLSRMLARLRDGNLPVALAPEAPDRRGR